MLIRHECPAPRMRKHTPRYAARPAQTVTSTSARRQPSAAATTLRRCPGRHAAVRRSRAAAAELEVFTHGAGIFRQRLAVPLLLHTPRHTPQQMPRRRFVAEHIFTNRVISRQHTMFSMFAIVP